MTRRPVAGEAEAYYFGYINRVPGNLVLPVLASQLGEMLALFDGISEDQSLQRYAPDKWTIRQALNHVNDAERLFAFRAFWFARGFDSSLPSFDNTVAVNAAAANNQEWRTLVQEFRTVRAATLGFFRSLPQAAWDRRGVAGDNGFTVRALAYIIAGHALHHNRILRERYLSVSRT